LFQTKFEDKIETRIVFNDFVCRQYCRLWGNVEEFCRKAGQPTDDNAAHAHCMLDH